MYVTIHTASGSPSYTGPVYSRHRTAEAAIRRAERENRALRRRPGNGSAYDVLEAFEVSPDDLDGERLYRGRGTRL